MSRTIVLFYLVLSSSLFGDLTHCSDINNGTTLHHNDNKTKDNIFEKLWRTLLLKANQSKEKISILKRRTFFDQSSLPHDPEITMNPVQIIVNRGYPVASYSVSTDDGYILELHRIPGSAGQSAFKQTYGKPVFLQHGLLGSSADWITNPSDRALAFRLADQGYDVWLGNARGNTYSRKHKTRSPSQRAYWNFSWDEMGKYDIPAVLNFILAKTGREKLIYIGHSMGCSMFFVAMATHPELKTKIELMIGLAPAVSLAHMISPAIRMIAPYVKHVEFLLNLLHVRAFLPNDSPINFLKRKFCRRNNLRLGICRNMLFFVVGDDSDNLELELLPVINGNTPAGTSIRTMAQFAMNLNSGQTFIPYDHGFIGNYIKYGKFRPPPYDLTRVDVPVYLFYGLSDHLVTPKDVLWLADQLPNLKEAIQVDFESYNHVNFLWGKHNNKLIYDKIISILPPPTS